MFFAIAALLIHPQIAPKISYSAEKIVLLQPTTEVASTSVAETTSQPVAATEAAALPDAPISLVADPAVPALILAKPSKPMKVSVDELIAENHRKQLIWRGLIIASSSAATFDAWSTRHAITTDGAQELNPMLRPFAGNASLYAAIQVGPVLMDYLGRKMMYSRHSWVRRMWWVPQTASIGSSLFCGAHNVALH